MEEIANWSSVVFAALASIFWIWSASIKVPNPRSYYGKVPEDAPEILSAAKVRSKNQIAAILTGIATASQAASQLIQTLSI